MFFFPSHILQLLLVYHGAFSGQQIKSLHRALALLKSDLTLGVSKKVLQSPHIGSFQPLWGRFWQVMITHHCVVPRYPNPDGEPNSYWSQEKNKNVFFFVLFCFVFWIEKSSVPFLEIPSMELEYTLQLWYNCGSNITINRVIEYVSNRICKNVIKVTVSSNVLPSEIVFIDVFQPD